MTTKTCSRCKVDKPSSEFAASRKGTYGLQAYCRTCCRKIHAKWQKEHPERHREYNAKWEREHVEKTQARRENWRAANRERSRVYAANWRKENPEKGRTIGLRWRQNNKARITQHLRTRRKTDPAYALVCRLRRRLCYVLKGRSKAAPTLDLLGCDRSTLLVHIEAMFQPGMTWGNRNLWHIDHILPCASFDLLDPEQQRACFHYTNLQPLWAADNLKKRASVLGSSISKITENSV